jgi:hypothetical protein
MPIYDHDNPNQGHHMRITPKTEKELAEENLFPAGEYDFEIASAIETVSKSSGRDMIKVALNVFCDGKSRQVTDYLMESMGFKLRHFFYGIGFGDRYDAGDCTAQGLVGRAGRVVLKVEEQDGYLPKNAVRDYIVSDENKAASTAAKVAKPAVRVAAASEVTDEPPF